MTKPPLFLLALLLAGCGGYVASSFQGRTITAHESSFLSSANLRGVEGGWVVALGGKTVRVWSDRVTWDQAAHLNLPDGWSQIDLAEAGNAIVVTVDGKQLATIYPSS